MKQLKRVTASLLLGLSWNLVAQGTPVALPAAAALPLGSSTQRGFLVRAVQAPSDTAVDNSFLRALRQLNGTLTAADGTPIPDESFPGTQPGGLHPVDRVGFEKDAQIVEIKDAEGNSLDFFFSDFFPGIPGMTAHSDHFAIEVVAFLELSAGEHTFGISVSADRTDVNDDDGYAVFVAANPRDYFGTRVADYRRAAQAFVSNQQIENQWTVSAPVAGIYPFRLVYWQTGRAANLHWYSIERSTGLRILVNDSFDPAAIKAYRNSTVAAANAPYVAEVRPLPGSSGIDPATAIEALLINGASSVTSASIRLFLNDAPATPLAIDSAAGRTSIRHEPNPARTAIENLVRLEFSDSTSVTYTSIFNFAISTSGHGANPISGQWDFNQGDLRATVGRPLTYLDGPDGITRQKTEFGTTTAFGIPDIAGEVAHVMRVPGDLDRRIGYVMDHGLAPNGGGTRVNQFTLIMDVFVVDPGAWAASLLQISSPDNTDDGDLFWQQGNFGQGGEGYNGKGTFTAGAWHRMAAAYDMAATPPVVVKFVDGIKQDDWTANHSLDHPRRALLPTAVLFADGDQDERREMFVNSIQIRNGRLSDAQLAILGGPSAAGIPATLPTSNVTGQWDFHFGDLSPTIGSPLAYLDGPAGVTAAGTRFGLTGEEDFAAIPPINGESARIMRVPGDLDRRIGYVMEHRIAPNGGGTRVNQFTLIMDVMIGSTGPGAASMLQVSSPENTDDGDLFWQDNNFGQGSGGYNGTGIFTPGEWHRVVAAYDMAASPPVVVKYVNGEFQDNWTANQALDHPRRALLPTAILFADGDQDERREWWVNSIQIRSGRLSNEDIEFLGGPSAAGIPILLPVSTPPALTITRADGVLTLAWPAEITGYQLESADTLPATVWTPVPGVAGNSTTVEPSGNARYYRLRRP